jgi:hypothetical protein
MTREGEEKAQARFYAFKKGWAYAKFHTKHNEIYMKDYCEHGSRI